MHGDVLVNGGDEFRDAAKDAARQAIGRDTAEEALDHIEPGGGGRGEMDVKARMLLQPFLDLGVLVRTRSCRK